MRKLMMMPLCAALCAQAVFADGERGALCLTFDDRNFQGWEGAATEKGGCVTLDLRIDMRNGRLDAVQADQFRRVRTALPSTGQ